MYSGGGDGYYGEQGGRRGDGYGGGYGEEGGGGGGYGRHGGGGGEYGHHSGYDEQGYRRQEEYGGGRDEEGDYRRGAEHHHGRPPPQSSISESEQLMKIYCAANPDYLITVRDDDVVLVPGNEVDESQQFIKDCRWGSRVQDEKGSPAFAIVHKASGMALKHGSESFDKVGLQRYDPDTLDESVLWTQSDDVGDGYQCLRPVGDVHLNLDVKGGESIRSGAELILFKWNKQENQMWKIMPIQNYAYSGGY